jgi:hypothetical protein
MKGPLNYSFMDQIIPEVSFCKYLGIIIRSDLSWIDQEIHGPKSLEGTRFRNAYCKKGQ